MEEEQNKVFKIKEQIDHNGYDVDPTAVADALLARLRELACASREQVSAGERASVRSFHM